MTDNDPKSMTDKDLLAQVRGRYDRLYRGDDVLELADRYEKKIRKTRKKDKPDVPTKPSSL